MMLDRTPVMMPQIDHGATGGYNAGQGFSHRRCARGVQRGLSLEGVCMEHALPALFYCHGGLHSWPNTVATL
jgi:hypothetical protein